VASTSVIHGTSGRYAFALFELARDAYLLDKVEADLKDVPYLLDNNRHYALFCPSSSSDNDRKSNVVDKVRAKAGDEYYTVKCSGHAIIACSLIPVVQNDLAIS
jgi:F0F1-type ATP synthase, delta subunit (mitochondrial oligomycin sensitivity protein)